MARCRLRAGQRFGNALVCAVSRLALRNAQADIPRLARGGGPQTAASRALPASASWSVLRSFLRVSTNLIGTTTALATSLGRWSSKRSRASAPTRTAAATIMSSSALFLFRHPCRAGSRALPNPAMLNRAGNVPSAVNLYSAWSAGVGSSRPLRWVHLPSTPEPNGRRSNG